MNRSQAGEWIPVREPSAVARARRVAGRLAASSGLSQRRCDEWAIAVTEAASNILRRAGEGTMVLSARASGCVEMWALDEGPGIRDLAWALVDGSSDRGGAGLGLGAVRRLSDQFDVTSKPRDGTVLYAGIGAEPDVSGVALPREGGDVTGDGWAFRRSVRPSEEGSEGGSVGPGALFTFDGLGHGEAAARAAEVALEAFAQADSSDPAAILRAVSRSLAQERGGVGSLVLLEGGRATFAGVGNVEARILAAGGEGRRLLPRSGTLGVTFRSVHPVSVDLEPGAVIVMATDGLRTRWSSSELGGGIFPAPSGSRWACCSARVEGAEMTPDSW